MPKNLVPNQFDYSGIYVEGQRSQFPVNKGVQDTFMSGMLVPLGDPFRVFPGVKLDLQVTAHIMSNTMVAVPLNGIYFDMFAVWVPDRIVWTHQPQFLGENDITAWTQSSTYVYPSVTLGTLNNTLENDLTTYTSNMDVTAGNLFLSPHFGLFYGVSLVSNTPAYSQEINVNPYRAYYAAWNHLFRDENYQRPVLFSKGDTGSSGEFGYFLRDYAIDPLGGVISDFMTIGSGLSATHACLMPVNKLHDAFTSVLPEPQFGNAVGLGIGMTAPVITSSISQDTTNWTGLVFKSATNVIDTGGALGTSSAGNLSKVNSTAATGAKVVPSNLVADLTNALGSINQFRANVMTQRFLEALARGGRRVPELYEAIWSVKNTRAQYDYPELLSHERYALTTQQVVATADSSGSGWSSHLGDRGAYSLTKLSNIPVCQKDFTEFGYLLILYCVRSTNQYSQFIPQHFTRSVLLDEYNPYFDHVGDSAIPNHIVNVLASTKGNFGYQESWWFERTQQNMTLSALNKAYGSLAYHTLGEVFDSSLLTCTPGYLAFDPAVFNDVFVSHYCVYPQFIIDANIHGKKVARMSQHSIPGIVGRI